MGPRPHRPLLTAWGLGRAGLNGREWEPGGLGWPSSLLGGILALTLLRTSDLRNRVQGGLGFLGVHAVGSPLPTRLLTCLCTPRVPVPSCVSRCVCLGILGSLTACLHMCFHVCMHCLWLCSHESVSTGACHCRCPSTHTHRGFYFCTCLFLHVYLYRSLAVNVSRCLCVRDRGRPGLTFTNQGRSQAYRQLHPREPVFVVCACMCTEALWSWVNLGEKVVWTASTARPGTLQGVSICRLP